MVNKFHQILIALSCLALIYSCNQQKSSHKETITEYTKNNIDSFETGSHLYKRFCFTCHGYTVSATYYQPSLDSMFTLLEHKRFKYSIKTSQHNVLKQYEDSININYIIFYIEEKSNPTLH